MEKQVKAYNDAKRILEIVANGDHPLHNKVAGAITVKQLQEIIWLVSYYEGRQLNG